MHSEQKKSQKTPPPKKNALVKSQWLNPPEVKFKILSRARTIFLTYMCLNTILDHKMYLEIFWNTVP